LAGNGDLKLIKAAEIVDGLLRQNRSPIVFCRFIPTAEYVAEELRRRLGSSVTVEAVTSRLPPDERQHRVEGLAHNTPRVLVATDCLSEGINLQAWFDAVLHYDLAWNPTRHEQREGRVDRYGQPRDSVRVVTYWGKDNGIDGRVLKVLIEKHRQIRTATGVSVPIPEESSRDVMDAILEGFLLAPAGAEGRSGELFEDVFLPRQKELNALWDAAADREKRSRTIFAQESIKPEEVAPEVAASVDALGSPQDLERFTVEALRALGATIRPGAPVHFDLSECPKAMRDMMGVDSSFEATFEPPSRDGADLLTRSHPRIAGLAAFVLDQALDATPSSGVAASRTGVARTGDVLSRTTLLLLRLRHQLTVRKRGEESVLLVEEARLVGFEGSPADPRWLDPEAAERLVNVTPSANVPPEQACDFLRKVIEAEANLREHLAIYAKSRAETLLESHQRVRRASGLKPGSGRVEPLLPVDILGIYVLLPA
jgi:hypothetical protein